MEKFKKMESAGAVVYIKDKPVRYLILKHNAGHWGFPKGQIDKQETPAQTAIREVKEETGLKVILKKEPFIKTHYFFRENEVLISKVVYFFLAEAKGKNIRISDEHTDFRWVIFEDAKKYLKFKTQIETLDKAKKLIR